MQDGIENDLSYSEEEVDKNGMIWSDRPLGNICGHRVYG